MRRFAAKVSALGLGVGLGLAPLRGMSPVSPANAVDAVADPAVDLEPPAPGVDVLAQRRIPTRPAAEVSGVRLSTQANTELPVEWEQQINGYYCGPTATRMGLEPQTDSPPSQDELATMLGTDQDGTDHIGLVTDVMNQLLDTDHYNSILVDYTPTEAQKDQFRTEVRANIDAGYAIVANIMVVAGGPRPEGYPSGDIYHYVTVIGYSQDSSQVLVADPTARRPGFENVPEKYWIDTDKMTTLIGGKGYSA